jgi:hypothetical protein
MANGSDKENILKFVQEVDDFATKMENHPVLAVYFIGAVDQLRNGVTAARTRFDKDE